MWRRFVLFAACAGCGSSGDPGTVDAPPGADAPRADAMTGPVEDIHFIGRFDGAQRFAWPGTRIATRFTGSEVSVELTDGGLNWFDVIIDGVTRAPPLRPSDGRATYLLASGLAAGEHDLVLARRTESFWGPTTFHGFPGAQLVPTAGPARLIELVGDSITCGYGVLGVGPSCEFDADTEAETHAWGTFAADALDAAHVAIAYSGIGMARNNSGTTTDTMPERYLRTLAEDPASTWDFSYTPDVVVVALGTNDFAGGDPGAPYVTAYTEFVEMLRTRFPAAAILLATSPMMSDSFPAGAQARTIMRQDLDQVVATVGDPAVTVVEIAEQQAADGYGCDFHPSEATAHVMADALVPAIRAATGW